MPTKAERILALLPRSFEAAADPSALRAVVNTFGGELLAAENSLAAVMRAHWVDHADKGATEIEDLKSFAALWGLAPREDESVEEFREHLKRYVRTFLEGTSTVQGILRVTAEALGLRIADADEDLDPWWRRASDGEGGEGGELATREPDGDDAAELLFGAGSLRATGAPALPAAWTGTVDLSGGADLRAGAVLRVAIDGAAPVTVDLAAGEADPARIDPARIAGKINAAAGREVAQSDGRFVSLASPTVGAASRLDLPEGEGDAAGAVLGLSARTVKGEDARPARLTGTVDLSGGVDLAAERYLRVAVDGSRLAEVDCAGPDPAHTTLDQVRDAVAAALGAGVASHDGHFLTLTSPTKGFKSTVSLLEAAAQDARARLFGAVSPFQLGADARPARLTGTRDLSASVDLGERSRLRVRLDGNPAVTVDCAGPTPGTTRLEEIALALNAILGAGVASHDGRFLTLASPTAGAAASVAVEEAAERDAAFDLLGLHGRSFRGSPAEAARFTSTQDLHGGVNLWGRHRLAIAIDGREPVAIDLWAAGIANLEAASLDDLKKALDAALGSGTASHDGHFLTLASPAAGAGSALAVTPVLRERRRRFVTRAYVVDEAATALLGFVRREARGAAATTARLVGTTDLSRGLDLRQDRFVRLAVDGAPAVDVDCAGVRPRATTLDEVIAKINQGLGKPVATTDGRHLLLVSPAAGAGSRLAFEPSHGADALGRLLGVEPGLTRGRDATTVRFIATVDLAAGLDLPAGAAVKLGIDGAAAVEIPLAAGGAIHAGLGEIVNAINVAIGGTAVAGHDGIRLRLSSRAQGAGSRLAFEVPAGTDVTAALFGVSPPRSYQGTAAASAQVIGNPLSLPVNLETARFLLLGVDGAPPVEVDCAAGAADPKAVDLPAIVAALNAAVPGVAAAVAGRLVLTSPTQGFSSRIALEPYAAGDARRLLLGDGPDSAAGAAPAPAVLTGEVDLLQPADLSRGRVLRIAVDGGPALDVDVAGASPGQTFLDEVVAALNAAVPGLASATDDDRLRLTSPGAGPAAGEESRLEILPLRALELQEYPPEPMETQQPVRHGGSWKVIHSGAAGVPLEIEIRSALGVLAPGVIHRTLGWGVRVLAAVGPGERAVLRQDAAGVVRGEIVGVDGKTAPLPADAIRILGSGSALTLARGLSEWLYLEALASRFDQARFDEGRFAGFPCTEVGVFDASDFAPVAPIAPVFGPLPADSGTEVVLRWESHRPGAFVVNLPTDLPSRFGGRFDEARYTFPQPTEPDKYPGEPYLGAVTEPASDPLYLVTRVNASSKLVKASPAPRAPLGYEAVSIPFRRPRSLTLGGPTQPARLYLAEAGVPGVLLLEAVEPGAWGNDISVVTRAAGPGAWDVFISLAGARFENARETVLGPPLPALAQDLLKPGPIGVLQAKAAGVEARVTRDLTEPGFQSK